MGIDVQLRSENREVLAEVGDQGAVLSRAVTASARTGTRLLRYLVPWGDAVFNQAQVGDLLLDVRDVVRENAGEPLAELLERISPLVDRLSAGSHRYLWFAGD